MDFIVSDLTFSGTGVFAVGGAVPETPTWAMMLMGFGSLGFAGYRASRKTAAETVTGYATDASGARVTATLTMTVVASGGL